MFHEDFGHSNLAHQCNRPIEINGTRLIYTKLIGLGHPAQSHPPRGFRAQLQNPPGDCRVLCLQAPATRCLPVWFSTPQWWLPGRPAKKLSPSVCAALACCLAWFVADVAFIFYFWFGQIPVCQSTPNADIGPASRLPKASPRYGAGHPATPSTAPANRLLLIDIRIQSFIPGEY